MSHDSDRHTISAHTREPRDTTSCAHVQRLGLFLTRGAHTNRHPKRGKSAMAASALRYAVRRLGGRELQRAQRSYAAAADDVQSGRTVWPTTCRRSNSSASCVAATNSSTERAGAQSAQENKEYLASIQQEKILSKQEELFQLIAKMDRELPSYCSKDNRQLLMHLSVRVQPKPEDWQWRFYRRAFTANRCVVNGSYCILAIGPCFPGPGPEMFRVSLICVISKKFQVL